MSLYSLLKCIILFFFYVYVNIHIGHSIRTVRRTSCGNWFSASIMLAPGMGLRFSDLGTYTLNCGAISATQAGFFFLI